MLKALLNQSLVNATNSAARQATDSGKHDKKFAATDDNRKWDPRKHRLCDHCGGRHFSDKCTHPTLKGTRSFYKQRLMVPPEQDNADAHNVDLINRAFASWENAASDTRLDPLSL